MELIPHLSSAAARYVPKYFGHFHLDTNGNDVSVPFDKDMAYAVTWVPNRKLLMIYGFDPKIRKPFTTPQPGIQGLQQNSYYEIRKVIFEGYSFDALLYPLDLGVKDDSRDQSLQDFLVMQQRSPSTMHRGGPVYTVWRNIANIFIESTGSVVLTGKPNDNLTVGSQGTVKLPEPGNY